MIKYIKKNSYERINKYNEEAMYKYADEYIDFLNRAKTEYKCIEIIEHELITNGFKNINEMENLNIGDKVYYINKERCLYAAIIGKEQVTNGVNIIGSHIDSPRLDTKPMPLFENQGMALMKTQYYGGIKKYQWVTIPLAIIGVVCKKDGTTIDVCIGEDENDPVVGISDLLIHLSGNQMQKPAATVIEGEDLDLMVGSIPLTGEEKATAKDNVLRLLKEKYDFEEEDFLSAELEVVPAGKARDYGLDRSMVAGYGHDD